MGHLLSTAAHRAVHRCSPHPSLTAHRAGPSLLAELSPAFVEEVEQQLSAFLGTDSADDLDAVQGVAVADEIPQGATGPGFGVPGAEDDGVDPGQGGRPGAHGAGFEGDDEGAAVESPVLTTPGGFAEGDDLGVPGGIVVDLPGVGAGSDDLSSRVDDDGSDGHISRLTCCFGEVEGGLHPVVVAAVVTGCMRCPLGRGRIY